MVARKTWAVIGGALGLVGVAGGLGAAATEPREPVALDAVQITTAERATQAPAPETTPTQTATTAATPSPSETPSPEEADDDSSGHGSGPTVVSAPSPITADSAD
jgi:hypothetical protein